MNIRTIAAAVLIATASSFAQTTPAALPHKPCEELKAEIGKKLEAKGVVNYALEVIDKGKEGDGKVVGTCDGGTKTIVYSRGSAPQAEAQDKKKPE